jgi:GNAT superfamily N-acetyltransferase
MKSSTSRHVGCRGRPEMTCRGQERRFVTRNRHQLVEGLRIAKAKGGSCLSRTIRPPGIEELPALSALCFRSKAVWGYDNDFMEACCRELSIEPCDLRSTSIAVAEQDGRLVGVAQIKVTGSGADLLKPFVEPTVLRSGIGRALFAWVTDLATRQGADRLVIEADPDAAPFYRRMGAQDIGLALSSSIPGRMLPKLVKDLCSLSWFWPICMDRPRVASRK